MNKKKLLIFPFDVIGGQIVPILVCLSPLYAYIYKLFKSNSTQLNLKIGKNVFASKYRNYNKNLNKNSTLYLKNTNINFLLPISDL